MNGLILEHGETKHHGTQRVHRLKIRCHILLERSFEPENSPLKQKQKQKERGEQRSPDLSNLKLNLKPLLSLAPPLYLPTLTLLLFLQILLFVSHASLCQAPLLIYIHKYIHIHIACMHCCDL